MLYKERNALNHFKKIEQIDNPDNNKECAFDIPDYFNGFWFEYDFEKLQYKINYDNDSSERGNGAEDVFFHHEERCGDCKEISQSKYG